jgi:hypothetical protein
MRQRERVTFNQVSASNHKVSAGLAGNRKSTVHRSVSGVEKLLDLQRSHGNAFVQRLVQHKLAVGRAGDRYGQEADRVANAVVRKEDASGSISVISRYAEPFVRRQCTECEEAMQRQASPGEEEKELQRKAWSERVTSGSGQTEARILQDRGHRLPETERAYTKPGFDVAASTPSITGVIARQPDPSPPPDPGWSDAPEKGLNQWVTTVDERGNIVPGKAATKGVWRVPIEGLSRGFQGTDKGPAFESPGGKAVALIPNIVNSKPPEKEKTVPVDVLLHFHGHGVGYRELEPGKSERLKVLKAGQLRDVELYQMEQQLLSHVQASKRLIIAVLPQGSERSGFGDLSSNSDAYLKEVFAKLVPKYLPQGAIPGRMIVSGHSGGGPRAMEIAAKAGKRTDVLLFDAINSSCTEKEEVKDKGGNTVTDKKGNPVMKCKKGSPCASNEYVTASKWVTDRIKADIKSLDGKSEDQKKTELQMSGTRFRGYTSVSLTATDSCSYGFWYKKLKNDIETTIKNLKVSEAEANQLRQNYQVQEAKGLTGLKGNEPHERAMGQGNLEAALKD